MFYFIYIYIYNKMNNKFNHNDNYYEKYIKYKNKYMELKKIKNNISGGADIQAEIDELNRIRELNQREMIAARIQNRANLAPVLNQVTGNLEWKNSEPLHLGWRIRFDSDPEVNKYVYFKETDIESKQFNFPMELNEYLKSFGWVVKPNQRTNKPIYYNSESDEKRMSWPLDRDGNLIPQPAIQQNDNPYVFRPRLGEAVDREDIEQIILENDALVIRNILTYLDNITEINGINLFGKYLNKTNNNLILFFGDNHTDMERTTAVNQTTYDHLCDDFDGNNIAEKKFPEADRSTNPTKPFITDIFNKILEIIESGNFSKKINLILETSKTNSNCDYYESRGRFMTPLLNEFCQFRDSKFPGYKYFNIHYTDFRNLGMDEWKHSSQLNNIIDYFLKDNVIDDITTDLYALGCHVDKIMPYFKLNLNQEPEEEPILKNRYKSRLDNFNLLILIIFTFGLKPQNIDYVISNDNVAFKFLNLKFRPFYTRYKNKYSQYYHANRNLNISEFLALYFIKSKRNPTGIQGKVRGQDISETQIKNFFERLLRDSTDLKFITNDFEYNGKIIKTSRFAKQLIKVKSELHGYLFSYVVDYLTKTDIDITENLIPPLSNAEMLQATRIINKHYMLLRTLCIDFYLICRTLYYSGMNNTSLDANIEIKNTITIVYGGEGHCTGATPFIIKKLVKLDRDGNRTTYEKLDDNFYDFGKCDLDTYGHISSPLEFIRKNLFEADDYVPLIKGPSPSNRGTNYSIENDEQYLKKYTRLANKLDCVVINDQYDV